MKLTLTGALALIAFTASSAVGQVGPTSSERVAFESGSLGRALEVELLWGRVTVLPHSGDDVRFTVGVDGPADGPRPLLTPSGYEITQSEGRIVFRADEPGTGVFRALDVTAYVPAGLDIRIGMGRGGDIRVDGVDASIEISNYNGSVSLTSIAGDAQVDARNGEIAASFRRVTPGRVLMFATLNGGVTVTLPSDYRGDLHVVAGSEEVYSDFDVAVTERGTGPPVQRGPARGSPTRVVKGQVNGGGPLLYVQTHNGPVTILKGANDAD